MTPNDKILEWFKLKAFADDKRSMAKWWEKKVPKFESVENVLGKEENAGYQHFLLFPKCFQRPSTSRSYKRWIVWQRAGMINRTFRANGKTSITRSKISITRSKIPVWITFCRFHQNKNCRLQTLSVWKSLKFVVWERVK